MNQVFAATTAVILAFFLFGIGKKPRRGALAHISDQNLINSNNGQIELINTKFLMQNKQSQVQRNIEKKTWENPKNIRDRLNLQKELYNLSNGNPEERLNAMIIADLWGHANVLPILKKGLKDFDSRVIATAASALDKHRKVTTNIKNDQSPNSHRPPRNVSLMR